MNKSIFLCFISLLFIGCTTANKNYNDINPQRKFTPISSNWEFRQVGGDKWYSASVPGVVHTDLLKNGVIEHPYYSTNETKLQWIEREQWEYKTTFSVTIEQLAAASLNMVFKGIDTYAEVYLNDEKIIDADNMFVEWKADVKSIIKEGDNQLRVLFKSAYDEGLKRMDGYPKLPADNDKGEIKTSVFSRKAQYHYGWDWGPRFVTAGLWKGVYLECSPATVIDDVWYVQKFQSDSLAQFTANISIHSISNDKINIVVQNENGDVYAQKDGVELVAGENIINMPFEIKNPQLWWPNGMGKEKPKLYSVVAAIVSVKDKSLLDKKIHRLGVRTIELVREPDQWGESFFFKVNGVSLFMKGANIIPQDVFLTEVTAERQRKLVDVAVESNMNMLRIWGGGIYEADELYDYCDENGILLWQDFPFACSFYPWDDRFFESVRLEARQNIRRLRNHPSLAIWCGNNEVDEAWHRWGYTNDSKNYPWSEQDKIDIRKGIDDLFFDDVIPGVVKAEDPHRPYHPSSPMFGWGDKRSQTHGDVHYWGVFHGEEPFSVYKDKPGRFSNEYGHQSFANYDTWRKWLKEEEIEYLSEAFKIHQKNPKGYRVIEDYMKQEVDYNSNNIREYIYLSQLVQADGIKVAMEGHRQNRPFTMGSLYWQLNDCWAVTSWSSMGYEYDWKALQYFARSSFAPTILSFDYEKSSDMVEIWAITDELKDSECEYNLSLISFEGKELWSRDGKFTVKANSSQKIEEKKVDEYLNGAPIRDTFLKLSYDVSGRKETKFFYFLPYKDLNFKKADFQLSYTQNGREVIAEIKANNLLKAILFESEAIQENPSDAYFDMYPGETRKVKLTFEKELPLDDYKIRVTTLNNILIENRTTSKKI